MPHANNAQSCSPDLGPYELEDPRAVLTDVRQFLLRHQDIPLPQTLFQRIVAAIEGRPARTFPRVSCSQCGRVFGPGVSGFSSCVEHRALA